MTKFFFDYSPLNSRTYRVFQTLTLILVYPIVIVSTILLHTLAGFKEVFLSARSDIPELFSRIKDIFTK